MLQPIFFIAQMQGKLKRNQIVFIKNLLPFCVNSSSADLCISMVKDDMTSSLPYLLIYLLF